MKSRRTTTGPKASSANAIFDSLEQEVYLNLWRTYERLKLLESELFSQFRLTAQQYNLLRLLQQVHPKPLPTLKIAKRLISVAPDITRMLDRLERDQLVRRTRPADNRRVVHVNLTSAGLDLLRKLAPRVEECHARQLGHLKVVELKRLRNLLKQVRLPHEDKETFWR